MSIDTQPNPVDPDKLRFSVPERIQSLLPRKRREIMMRKLAQVLKTEIVPGFEFVVLVNGVKKKYSQIRENPPPGYKAGQYPDGREFVASTEDPPDIIAYHSKHHPNNSVFTKLKSNEDSTLGWNLDLHENEDGSTILNFCIGEGRRWRYIRFKQEYKDMPDFPAPTVGEVGKEPKQTGIRDFELP